MVTLPPRYIRDDEDPPFITLNPSRCPTIPVIDMQKLLYGDNQKSEMELMNAACKEWGFFQLINHGVQTTMVEETKDEILCFFQLSPEEKKKFWQQENELEGFGQTFIISDEQKLEWGDMFFMTTLPVHARKPQLFPKLPLSLRDTLEDYSLQVNTIVMKILENMEQALKMEVGDITKLFENVLQSVIMGYYPRCPQPELAIGLAPHSDAGGLTILLQVTEVEGLQVKKDGSWIPVKPLPNAFIVNIGDMLEIITNGIYSSVKHRATVNKDKERLSMATFHGPGFDVEIGPAKSLVTPEYPAMYRRIMAKDYYKGFFERKLDGNYIDVVRIPNKKDD